MTGSKPIIDASPQASPSPQVPSADPLAIASLPLHPDIWQETLGWCPSDRQQQQFQQLYHQICVGNQSLNLTRITQPDEFWEKHLWDSLSGIHFLLTENQMDSAAKQDDPSTDHSVDSQIERVLDLGTGAGFPGLPVAIARPHWQLTLLDSTRKKIAFIDSILSQLDLGNVRTFTHRAETLGRNSHHRYQYDLVLVRAVAAAPVCAEYALPFLKVGGQSILYRGHWTPEEEDSLLYALDLLGGTLEAIYEWETPLNQGDRHCIIIRKTEKTPRYFPRDIGIPTKDPLA
ncbi:MAG: 16S rRNA (guanine(527)-N(7))-methyltransferase RsmG [Leptolyngbyaceae cyanobacterium]